MNDTRQFLTTEEAAEWLKVNDQTMRKYFRQRQIEAIKVGCTYRTRIEWIEEFVNRNRAA